MYQGTIVILVLIASAHSQKLCSFTSSPKTNVPVFLQHFSTAKCLRVTSFGILPASKVLLDECSYWKTPAKDQQYFLSNSTLGKYSVRSDAGLGDKFCLTTSRDTLSNGVCQQTKLDQNWTLKPVRNQDGKFLIEQFSSKKCLIPKTLSVGTEITLAPCNALVTEQIWKVCM